MCKRVCLSYLFVNCLWTIILTLFKNICRRELQKHLKLSYEGIWPGSTLAFNEKTILELYSGHFLLSLFHLSVINKRSSKWGVFMQNSRMGRAFGLPKIGVKKIAEPVVWLLVQVLFLFPFLDQQPFLYRLWIF